MSDGHMSDGQNATFWRLSPSKEMVVRNGGCVHAIYGLLPHIT